MTMMCTLNPCNPMYSVPDCSRHRLFPVLLYLATSSGSLYVCADWCRAVHSANTLVPSYPQVTPMLQHGPVAADHAVSFSRHIIQACTTPLVRGRPATLCHGHHGVAGPAWFGCPRQAPRTPHFSAFGCICRVQPPANPTVVGETICIKHGLQQSKIMRVVTGAHQADVA